MMEKIGVASPDLGFFLAPREMLRAALTVTPSDSQIELIGKAI
jgi:hypothetical protein